MPTPKQTPADPLAPIKSKAQQHGEQAIDTIAELMHDEKSAIRLSAAKEILDRAYGRPVQQNQTSGEEDAAIHVSSFDLSKMTDAQLNAYRIVASASERDREGVAQA